ncbi:MAG: DUF3857 and transglutaminase domain-containing protein, partial [Acidobacteria bacterium]|nr:DUF3857 and transglutaminase domain-containing protein [Acidobacteriota bacterium]
MKKLFRALAATVVALCFASALTAQKQDWQPVTQDELKMTKGVVDPDADAEAILWDVYVADDLNENEYETVLHHYMKVKIFNDRGRENFSKIDIEYGKIPELGVNIKIKEIAARTTKADGTTVELSPSDIFDKDVVKGSGFKLKAKSFAVPGIEAGAVIEYKWTEVRPATLHQRLDMAREIPVESVRYHISPADVPDMGMRGQGWNVQNTPFVKEKNGFWMTSASNVAAFKKEPQMPGEYAVRPWLLLFYASGAKPPEADKFWKDYAKKQYEEHRNAVKASDEVKQAAAEAVNGATTDEAKVQKIFDYVRAHVKNVADDSLGMTADDRKKLKDNKTPSDTLKRGIGTWEDIDYLFASMVNSVGLEARVVNLPRRSDMPFPKEFTDDFFMRTENIAVKLGDKWQYFDPGSKYIPYGMLVWQEEGQPALISDPKEGQWDATPMSSAQRSMELRSGNFKLLEDGTLEGTVKIEYTGHIAAEVKEYNDDVLPPQRESALKKLVKENVLSTAEISDISIENMTDPDKPVIYTFKIKVPEYATRTGKRLFFQPDVFERSSKPMFATAGRHYDIQFEYPYGENDEITIQLPTGFELESP